jgi:hypothetical protein
MTEIFSGVAIFKIRCMYIRMTVKELIDLAQNTVLTQLPLGNNTHRETIKLCFYLGMLELYKRFNLLIKTEVIHTCEETSVYDLRNTDVNQVLSIYDESGKELTAQNVIGSDNYDYKQLNYRSFLLTHPKDEYLMFVYKASPAMIYSEDDVLDLPSDMICALIDYVAYRGHSTINRDNVVEANSYYVRFEKDCIELEAQGYKVNLSPAAMPVQFKGFI